MVSVKSVKANVCINPYVGGSVGISVFDSVRGSTTLSVHDSINLNQNQVRDSINEEY